LGLLVSLTLEIIGSKQTSSSFSLKESILNHHKVYISGLFDCSMRREPKSAVDVLYEIFRKVDGPEMDGHQEAYLIGMEIIDREKRKESTDHQP